MFESITTYFLTNLSLLVLGRNLKSAANVVHVIILIVCSMIAMTLGNFIELTRPEFVTSIFLVVILYIHQVNYVSANNTNLLPLLFAPMLFILDEYSNHIYVFKLLVFALFYFVMQKRFHARLLIPVLCSTMLFLLLITYNTVWASELSLMMAGVLIFACFVFLPVNGERSHGLFYYLYIFLSIKLFKGLQSGVDLEFASYLTSGLVWVICLIIVGKIIEMKQVAGIELEVFASWHGFVYLISGAQTDHIPVAALIFILVYALSSFVKMEKISQVLLIFLTFLFVGYEVLSLQLTGMTLILSIIFKTLYVLVHAGKIQHKNRRLLL